RGLPSGIEPVHRAPVGRKHGRGPEAGCDEPIAGEVEQLSARDVEAAGSCRALAVLLEEERAAVGCEGEEVVRGLPAELCRRLERSGLGPDDRQLDDPLVVDLVRGVHQGEVPSVRRQAAVTGERVEHLGVAGRAQVAVDREAPQLLASREVGDVDDRSGVPAREIGPVNAPAVRRHGAVAELAQDVAGPRVERDDRGGRSVIQSEVDDVVRGVRRSRRRGLLTSRVWWLARSRCGCLHGAAGDEKRERHDAEPPSRGHVHEYNRPPPAVPQPSASATIPATMAAAPIARRARWPSARSRAPMTAPMRMPISRAGATYDTGLTTSAVNTRMYESRLRIPTPMTAPRRRSQVSRRRIRSRNAAGATTIACPTTVDQSYRSGGMSSSETAVLSQSV